MYFVILQPFENHYFLFKNETDFRLLYSLFQ
jgi:hypothetical protein